MKKNIICLFLFILSVTAVYSQVPGYRGKRCLVKVNAYGMPLMGFLFSDEKPFDFNMRFALGVDYVLTKSICIGASIEQTNDIVYLTKYTTTPYGSNTSSTPAAYKSAANFFGYSYGANIKFFSFRKSGSIAPFGRYILLEYLSNHIQVSDDGRYYSSGKKELNTINTSTFLLGIGTQKVVFNRFTIDTNLKYGMNLYGLARLQNAETRADYEEIYNVSSSKMFSDYLITLSLGIGILAF